MRVLLVYLFEKSFDCLVTYFLTNDKLVLPDLLVGVVVVIVFREVDSHASQQLGGEGANFLIEF